MPTPTAVRAIRLVAATAILLTVLPPPEARAAEPCDLAFALLVADKPQQAKREASTGGASFATDSFEKRVCATAEALASDRSARAVEAAGKARDAFDNGDFAAAKAFNANALALDAENATALAVKKDLDARPEGTEPVALAETWDGAVSDYLAPLGKLALMMALAFVALMIVARLSARLWWLGRSRVAAPGPRAGEWIVGVGLVGVASVGGVLALAGHPWVRLIAEPTKVAPTVFAVPALLLGLLGAGLVGWVNARQLRLTVGASNDKEGDTATTGRVLALLETMGGSAPQGLERPYGTDLQGFADALTGLELPSGGDRFAQFVGVLVGLVAGRTPWRVFVDAGQGSTSVAVLRHGRTVGSLVVTGEELTVEGVPGCRRRPSRSSPPTSSPSWPLPTPGSRAWREPTGGGRSGCTTWRPPTIGRRARRRSDCWLRRSTSTPRTFRPKSTSPTTDGDKRRTPKPSIATTPG